MKKLKILLTFVLAATVFGCAVDENDSLDNVNNSQGPSNISALFTITQDNTGFVTIAPTGEGVGSFEVYFGDGTVDPSVVLAGRKTTHNYAEGEYAVKIVGKSVTGKTAEFTHNLSVSFRAPEDLQVTVAPVAGDSFSINVSAKATYEAFFEVWFGESEDEEPVQFNEGQTITHTYAAIGTYEVKVVAYSGGAATTPFTQSVTITNPLLLPLTFENSTLNYAFGDFGGTATSVIDNPHSEGINTSTKVARLIKNPGETWAGVALSLDEVLNFSEKNKIRMKVWSPAAGTPIILKFENATNADINKENQQFTSVANEWEEITFDYSDIDLTQQFSKVVLFFNFGTPGTGESYYFDDIMQTSSADALVLPLTFESLSLDYGMIPFEGAATEIITNPDPSGINTSSKVVQFLKTQGAQTYAGVAIDLESPIDFSEQKKIKIKVWSPAAGKVILLKLENIPLTAGAAIEKQATTTVANAWEELTFDFSDINEAIQYQNVIIFCDFGNAGTGTTYYFDDVKQSN